MTNTDGGSKILKTDALGRVRTPAARRQQLLDEFEKSGASGAKFAELVGVKYQTFASWMQGRHVLHYPCASSITALPLAERGSAMTWGRMMVIGAWALFDDALTLSVREGAASPSAL